MRHKLLPVSAGHVTICTRSLVGEGDLVHHCDSGVSEAGVKRTRRVKGRGDEKEGDRSSYPV